MLQTVYSGLSRGTELDLYSAQMHGRPLHVQWYPMLPGYMPVDEVIEVGANVEPLKIDDLALVSNLFTGFDEPYYAAWAGHTEYVVVSKHSHGLGAKLAGQLQSSLR